MTITLSMTQRDQLVRFADLAEGRLLNPGASGWNEGPIVGTTTCLYHSDGREYEVLAATQPSFSKYKPDSDAAVKKYCRDNDYGDNQLESHVLYYLNSEMDEIISKHRIYREERRR